MPVSFSQLRITGFKSFAEPTGVEILPGLTGIVGPNGCGKSNIVEALRWAMGESSARGLRGGEMEDVIFAGTAGRASRNIAEVVLTLTDTHGVAPPPFHELNELEIQRRIERGTGSHYRINGKEARARDVQTLFADMASGARASAMVSQGRVGALVASRPEDRRAVLEEAAGITGLHARRHEAEMKLRAAEANLSRAEDLRAQLETQLGSLKRQARQASRYRNISGAIRTAEEELFSILLGRAEADLNAAKVALAEAISAAATGAQEATSLRASAEELLAALPLLRETEANRRTTVERCRVAREHLAAEEGRALAALSEARQRLAQLKNDLAHAEQIRIDAIEAGARLAAEDRVLFAAEQDYPARSTVLETEALAAAAQAQAAEMEAARAMEEVAEANARARAESQAIAQSEQQVRRLAEQISKARADHAVLAKSQVDPAVLSQAANEEAEAQIAVVNARAAVESAELRQAAASIALVKARESFAGANGVYAKLAAEMQALAEILAVKDAEAWPPMIDSVVAPLGLETALGAALGEELTSALDPGADRHWRELPPYRSVPPLPNGATALSGVVDAPAALNRSLSQIGLVDDESVALNSYSEMAPGQMLVSREGAVWRWDGYTIRAGAPTPAAVRLRHRNRLTEVGEALSEAKREAAEAHAMQAEAERLARAAAFEEKSVRDARRDSERRLEQATASLSHSRKRAASVAAQLAAVEEQLARLDREYLQALTALDELRTTRPAPADLERLQSALHQARSVLTAARSRDSAAISARRELAREQALCSDRRRAIASERTVWTERARDAASRVTDLADRLSKAQADLQAVEAIPAHTAVQQREAREALRTAEVLHADAVAALNDATAKASEADRAARASETALANRREVVVRAEGVALQAGQARDTVAERVLERLGADPGLSDLPTRLSLDDESKARARHERLVKERDEMGPVNLLAETEAETIGARIAAIDKEREELTTAIARLRGSIGNLNREGRERLSEVFQAVDRHFQQLFTRMFGGGRAHLSMIGSDDPLAAGLEIYAQPPGKKLAALSLLSGGEQALTALSLIFAVFRCNPAPICVLDEVDAPLDDANVERFCLLLEDIERETKTRFLVVTHHPMTMARMDRLYGVTMQERGVSRLLSVDLAHAAAMVDQRQLPLDELAGLAAD